jgi:hypothetical protein
MVMTTETITFGATQTVEVADLQVNDFVIQIPPQSGYRAVRVNSAIREIRDDQGTWTRSGGYRQRRVPLPSKILIFKDARQDAVNYPLDWIVEIRRPDGPAGMSLDEQIELLQQDYDAACRDTAADQGDEIVATGGWVELARATVDLADAGITAEAKAEFLRINGVERVS